MRQCIRVSHHAWVRIVEGKDGVPRTQLTPRQVFTRVNTDPKVVWCNGDAFYYSPEDNRVLWFPVKGNTITTVLPARGRMPLTQVLAVTRHFGAKALQETPQRRQIATCHRAIRATLTLEVSDNPNLPKRIPLVDIPFYTNNVFFDRRFLSALHKAGQPHCSGASTCKLVTNAHGTISREAWSILEELLHNP